VCKGEAGKEVEGKERRHVEGTGRAEAVARGEELRLLQEAQAGRIDGGGKGTPGVLPGENY